MFKKRRRSKSTLKNLKDLNFSPPKIKLSPQAKKGITIVCLITFGVISFLSLFDLAGIAGQYLNHLMQIVFGINRWYLPIIVIAIAYFLLRPSKYKFRAANTLGFFVFLFSFGAMVHIFFHADDIMPAAKLGLGGGYVGAIPAYFLVKFLGFWASLVMALALSAISFFLLFDVSLEKISEQTNTLQRWLEKIKTIFGERKLRRVESRRERFNKDAEIAEEIVQAPEFTQRIVEVDQAGSQKPKAIEEEPEEFGETPKEEAEVAVPVAKRRLPKVDLPLDLLDGKTTVPNGGDIKNNKTVIQKTLENFGIPAEMGEAQVGPTVTQYTLKPADGIKLSRITSLGDNLALALAAHPIRIEAPIPGRSLVGVEIPNQATAIVPLKEILASDNFRTRKGNLAIALGKDVMGKPWFVELDRMPHMLIAGSTGSGKSVCINSIIVSLLYQNGPEDLKFIMVDPKRVELPVYNGIPHLLTPVITDVKKTINALRWCITEMEKRFDILSQAGKRNIQSYNDSRIEKMPYIVVLIDELADLMAAAGPEVEAAIVRLSQMSRAVGIHLVLATQRPSVDVITGLIKANVTARIAFSVASLVDSRTILDMAGAEKLLGRGDMLFVTAEISKPKRLQGAFSSDDEIKRVIDYLKERSQPDYVEEVVERLSSPTGFDGAGSGFANDGGDNGDPLLAEAKDVIVRAKKASASLLQRRLRIGYARAARILDLLEEQGVIGPGDGAKPRDVLISSSDGDKMLSADDAEPDFSTDYEAPDELTEFGQDEEDDNIITEEDKSDNKNIF